MREHVPAAMRDEREQAAEVLDASGRLGRRLDCVPRILAVQNRRIGSPLGREDLKDLAQECLIVIWRKLGGFDPESLFESWVYRICLLELMNHVRKQRRRRRLVGELVEEVRERTSFGALPPAERYEVLYLALDVLDGEEAAVIRMRHFEERTFEEVGDRLHIPIGTAKTRYYRGLTKMKHYVQNHDTRRPELGTPRR